MYVPELDEINWNLLRSNAYSTHSLKKMSSSRIEQSKAFHNSHGKKGYYKRKLKLWRKEKNSYLWKKTLKHVWKALEHILTLTRSKLLCGYRKTWWKWKKGVKGVYDITFLRFINLVIALGVLSWWILCRARENKIALQRRWSLALLSW